MPLLIQIKIQSMRIIASNICRKLSSPRDIAHARHIASITCVDQFFKKISSNPKALPYSSVNFNNLYQRTLGFQYSTIDSPYTNSSKPKIPVQNFLQAHQLQYSEGTNIFKLKYCPLCPKPHNEQRSNLYVLNVHKQIGYFHCFRCAAKGSWLQLRQKILGINIEGANQFFTERAIKTHPGQVQQNRLSDAEYFIYKSSLWQEGYKDVRQYLFSRGFNEKTIRDYNIGAGVQQFYDVDGQSLKIKCVYFPNYKILKADEQKQKLRTEFGESRQENKNYVMQNNWTQIVKTKIRGASKENKKFMRQYPIGAQRGFFGLNLVKDTDTQIVITEGEFDAMAVYQQTGIPTLSLPQGATNLPEHFLPYLQKFTKIVLWMDNDQAGNLNRDKIAEKIGLSRTYLVIHNIPQMKDANDFLLSNPTMINQLIRKAKTIPENDLTTFQNLRDVIESRIYREEENRGIQVKWLPFFNKKVKGLRMGEITVVSGPTGSGKTTFLSQISLDICQKQISVLWGSFQIRTEILLTQMISQYSGVNLFKNKEKFNYCADKFAKLPLYFMNFYGSNSIEKVLSTITYSIEKYNIHLVIIDTLQFLLSQQGEGFKKFQIQDTLMARLRQISIKYNVHVIIVIHPRKTEDGQDIGIHSIYGTSKATQEADNIWLIQNRQGFKVFDIKKNRYDGELGRIPLGFNREVKQFFQLTKEQFEDLRGKEKTMSQIIKDRESENTNKQGLTSQQKEIFEEEIQDFALNKKMKPMNGWTKKQ